MRINSDVSLAKHSTMRLGGKAAYLTNITEKSDIANALEWATKKKLPVIMIGDGSNIVWGDAGFKGLVMVNKIKGFEITREDDENSYVTVGAGENWDDTVARTVKAGFHGIEALSLIPGTSGATPVQNVGAYGQEISDTLISLEAYDSQQKEFVTIPGEYCKFGYRTSRFKTFDRGRFFIVSLRLQLTTGKPKLPFYPAIQQYLEKMSITQLSPKIIREVVIAVRSGKLPDPKKVANNGSFFANPIVAKSRYDKIYQKYPDAPGWPTTDGKIKIPAAWLIEKAGFKNFHDKKTGMATWHLQPLVIVNEKAETTSDLIIFRDRIINDVKHTFDITLEQEPELIGT